MPLKFNLNLADNIKNWQKTAIQDAAEQYTKYIKDDITINLFFANSDNYVGSSVAAGAIPSFVGGLKGNLDYTLPNASKGYNFWNQVYSNGNNADVIEFEDFFNAVKLDRSSTVDSGFIQSLKGDLYQDGHSKTVPFYNSLRAQVGVKGIQLTSANAKALGLDSGSNDVDGIITFNPLSGIKDSDKNYIVDYKHIETYNSRTYQGMFQLGNYSGKDFKGEKVEGYFDLKGRIIEHFSDKNSGGLKITEEKSMGGGRYRYSFETTDTMFKAGELNHLGFTAKKTTASSPEQPVYFRLKNYDRQLQPGHWEVSVPVYGEETPVFHTYNEFKALATHEIAHVLGFTSAIDSVAPELGKYAVESYELGDLSNLEQNLAVEEQFRINPLDLARYTDFEGNVGVQRSLNPEIDGSQVKDLFFSHNGRRKLASFEVGQHLNSVDHLTGEGQYYSQGSHFDGEAHSVLNSHLDEIGSNSKLSNNDLKAIDLIGYDINYGGNLSGTVNTKAWNHGFDGDVADVLQARSRRISSRSSRNDQRVGFRAEDERIFIDSAENYDSYLTDLVDDLAGF